MPYPKTATKRRIRKYAVLNLIRDRQPISRAQIAEATDLQIPTVTHLVAELIGEGWLMEDGHVESPGSRGVKAAYLRLKPDGKLVAGVSVEGRLLRAFACDLRGSPLGQSALTIGSDAPQALLSGIQQVLAEALSAQGNPKKRIEAVGLALSGDIDRESGVLRSARHIEGWRDLPLRAPLQTALDLPVPIETDLNAAALGEHWFDPDRILQNLIYVHLADVIAAALVLQGRIYRGGIENPGAIGHLIVQEDGPLCYCGGSGCLETVASAGAVVSAVLEGLHRGVQSYVRSAVRGDLGRIDIATVASAADRGDRLAFNALDKAGRYIGQVMAYLVNLLSPDRVIVGGSLAAGESLLSSIRREMRFRVAPGWSPDERLLVPRMGEYAAACGAAALAIRHLLHLDEIQNVVCV